MSDVKSHWIVRVIYIDGSGDDRQIADLDKLAAVIAGGPDQRLIEDITVTPVNQGPIGSISAGGCR